MLKPKLKIAGTDASPIERSIAKRWTPKLIEQKWTAVANVFLDSYSRLVPPLTTPEAMFIIHLMRHKWDEKPPFPSFSTVAKRMGISATAVRNHARSLDVSKHYVKRIKRIGTSNKFDLTPLFAALEKLMDADAAKQKKRMPKSA